MASALLMRGYLSSFSQPRHVLLDNPSALNQRPGSPQLWIKYAYVGGKSREKCENFSYAVVFKNCLAHVFRSQPAPGTI